MLIHLCIESNHQFLLGKTLQNTINNLLSTFKWHLKNPNNNSVERESNVIVIIAGIFCFAAEDFVGFL